MYTVKQLSDLAGVSVRTLHYYDEIDVLKPPEVGDNGYRYYDDDSLFRLQQILFDREIGLELMQIKDVLDDSDFDLAAALRSHRKVLQKKIERLHELISTVDDTIMHLAGEITMSKKRLFRAFSEEEQKDDERQARLTYEPDTVNESVRNWNSYSDAKKAAIIEEGNQIYSTIAQTIDAGKSAHDEDVQKLLVRWHNHIRYFYEPSLDLLRGLGDIYNTPDFLKNFNDFHPQLAAYMREAIIQYVDDLEYAEIARMLAEDEREVNDGIS
jgi:DNA-binding transcriptional MerR regulator